MPFKTIWSVLSSLFTSGGSNTEKDYSERTGRKEVVEPPTPNFRRISRATRKIRRLTYLKTKPLPSLPPEPKAPPPLPPMILRRIFAFLKSSRESRRNRRFLLGCALVCRAWVFPSRAVALSGRIYLEGDLELVRSLAGLLDSPYCTLAPHIQWLDISWCNGTFQIFIVKYLPLLVNLVRLEIGVCSSDFAGCLQMYGYYQKKKTQLSTKLQILGIKWWDQSQGGVASGDMNMWYLFQSWFSPFPLRVLKVEEAQFGTMFTELPISSISRTIFASVERLELGLNQETFLRPPHANLRYLPQLTHLTLSFQSENRCQYGAETALTLLESIRSPLRSIHLQFAYPFELSPREAWGCLDAFLYSVDRLPHLRHLSFARVEPGPPLPVWDSFDQTIRCDEKQNKAEKQKRKPLFHWKTEQTKIAVGKAKPKVLKKFLPLCLKKGLFDTDDEKLRLDGDVGGGVDNNDTESMAITRRADLAPVLMDLTEFVNKDMPEWLEGFMIYDF
ncbi:hypothetical protein BDP27DRAFT_1446653 [Rhodocollybia butyracea]|uniref:F-box domain-containing protein n=1 Tax=Rhodocollybia butyracea TaxID=206335 RepID=A0A9P5PXL0_9AGAR|nr:hypothetical protein BDP27DRAFT_1446653 [Rhodocollybia butyracea]